MCVDPTCCIILQRQVCNVKFSERFIVFVVAVCCCNCSHVADRKQLTFNFYAIDYILLHPLRLVCVACVCAPPRDKLESLISETHIRPHTVATTTNRRGQANPPQNYFQQAPTKQRHCGQRGGYGRASADFLCTMNYFRGQRERIRLLPPHASLRGDGATQIYCELKTNLTPSRQHTPQAAARRERGQSRSFSGRGDTKKVRDPGQPARPARCFTSDQRRGAREACSGAARRLQGNRNGTMDERRVQAVQFGPLLDKTELN
jgi:hypothetical protein